MKTRLEQKNRIALIVLDSTLEIAFKEYLIHDSPTYYKDSQLASIFNQRHLVQQEMQRYITINAAVWKKISHYNGLRNKLIHERATAGISDAEIKDYREVVEGVLKTLYKLKFGKG